jgi:hypothetical protein
VQFEITREAWEALETIPKTAILGGYIWYSDGDPEEESPIDLKIKKPRKKDLTPKGPHGDYWNRMHVRGVLHNNDLAEALRLEGAEFPDGGNHIEVALRARFEVSSKTFISPDDFEQFLERHHLANLVTLSRQERAKLAEKARA